MTSTLKINTLTGVSTAGSIAVTGEAGSTTTNLQQGLCKAWFNANGTGTAATLNSFNISGITDNSTGSLTHTFTNNFANVNLAVGLGMSAYSPNISSTAVGSITTLSANSSGSATDTAIHTANLNGDLA